MTRDIPLSLIDRDEGQPRRLFDVSELAQSMAHDGLIVPIMVRPNGDRFTIVHGERRWLAAQSLGWEAIRAEVREVTADEARWLALVENVQRQDLTPEEEARAYEARLAQGMTQTELAGRLGKSQSYIAHKLRLLQAPPPLRALLAKGAISEGHVRELLRFERLYPPDKYIEASLLTEPADMSQLAALYDDLRPEEEPSIPLWRLSPEQVDKGAHRGALSAAAEGLISCFGEGRAPSWIVAAWWFGSAVVVYDLSVAQLSRKIDAWWRRRQSAIIFAAITPFTKVLESAGDVARVGWGFYSDLRHGGMLPVTKEDLYWLWVHPQRKPLLPLEHILPSALQRWGTLGRVGERLTAQSSPWMTEKLSVHAG